MKKIIALSLFALFAMNTAVYAETEAQQDVNSDVNAIAKDNASIAKHKKKLSKHRASKAANKAAGNRGQQAVDSVKIGADKTAIEEKHLEKKADEKMLDHHEKELNEENTK